MGRVRKETVMQAMTQQRGSTMQQVKKDPLVGNWFIVRGEHGRPKKAGRINSRTEDGEYIVRVWFDADGGPQHGETVPRGRLTAEGWLLFTNEASWRTAFATMQQ
jgi:hypothetical protein